MLTDLAEMHIGAIEKELAQPIDIRRLLDLLLEYKRNLRSLRQSTKRGIDGYQEALSRRCAQFDITQGSMNEMKQSATQLEARGVRRDTEIQSAITKLRRGIKEGFSGTDTIRID